MQREKDSTAHALVERILPPLGRKRKACVRAQLSQQCVRQYVLEGNGKHQKQYTNTYE